MRFAPFQSIETERLVLRKLRLEDVPLFYERLGGSEAVTKYMMWVPHRDIRESEDSIRKALQRYENGGFYRWAITVREKDEIIGIIDLLRFDEENSACQFAYMLGADYWNKGYATEALRAVFDFAFRQLQILEITADHMAENPASGAVMHKAGMTKLGVTPGKYVKNGTKHDAVHYRITKEDWIKQ